MYPNIYHTGKSIPMYFGVEFYITLYLRTLLIQKIVLAFQRKKNTGEWQRGKGEGSSSYPADLFHVGQG